MWGSEPHMPTTSRTGRSRPEPAEAFVRAWTRRRRGEHAEAAVCAVASGAGLTPWLSRAGQATINT